MIGHSYLSNADVSSIDTLYQQYRSDNESVDFGWRKFFEGFDLAYNTNGEVTPETSEAMRKEINVLNLINYGYRTRGHLFTKTNPVRERRNYTPDLDIANFDLEPEDLDRTFNAGMEIGIGPAKLKDIIDFLSKTYCNHIGAELMYILVPECRKWLLDKMESTQNTPNFSIDEKRHILNKLNQASVFENFLHTKYIGQKRFSLEGLEGLIPALDAIINKASELGAKQFVLGMAHRGRLNVLANVMGKTYEEIFTEFEGKAYSDAVFEGDVKYHMGYSSEFTTPKGHTVKLKLSPNPSHLEAVNTVVKGMAKAKLDLNHNNDLNTVIPILVHGDASISGQGIMYETVQMSALEPYNVGGTIHIVANNQIGFTTNYQDGRSSIYCTDVAKVTRCPVFHVNADDAEAIVYVMNLAVEFRQRYHEDVFIDLLGYRKYGHNEGDEPRFTQPVLYKAIAKHKSPREIYSQQLLESGKITAKLAREMEEEFKRSLQEKLDFVRADNVVKSNLLAKNVWAKYRKSELKDFEKSPDTSVKKELLVSVVKKITGIPSEYVPIQKISKLFKDRAEMLNRDSFDWAMGELLAYSTLLTEGFPVRMTGQDIERGTFSHRHAVLKKEDTELEYIPLNHISPNQKKFEIYNSNLSEFGVLGFEYGYSVTAPETLTIWEAQFGDFANGAQIIIDQFISSGETKWKVSSGLVLLLPHGYEGQGPEHSSARLERFLQLSANGNMQVINPTTPSSLFHALRRQMHRDFRTPLIVMTPKSLLRHPACVSKLEEFTKGGFKEVIDDPEANPASIKRVLFCSGKIYYELLHKKQTEGVKNIAIVRLEQLYPLPSEQINAIFDRYKKAEYFWVQEEPKNMGAWLFLHRYTLNASLKRISRESSSTPATGYAYVHQKEQKEIIETAFSL
ncbi:MAG: 2-oxoglutarate dehydrogenase E1 component [Flavobacteriales bacterium]|nr:2-oxoglutarate dehydrogenase E1 component [Flavobacteriales bacterium]